MIWVTVAFKNSLITAFAVLIKSAESKNCLTKAMKKINIS
jgi:hypothetical protein